MVTHPKVGDYIRLTHTTDVVGQVLNYDGLGMQKASYILWPDGRKAWGFWENLEVIDERTYAKGLFERALRVESEGR